MDRLASETQPLLQRPPEPINVAARCLLALSGTQLIFLLVLSFLCHTARAGNEKEWLELVHIFFKVDIVDTIGAVLAVVATAVIGIYVSASYASWGSRLLFPFVVGAAGCIGWSSLLRLSQAHHLEVQCYDGGQPGRCGSEALYSDVDVIHMWRTVPVGIIRICLSTVKRPIRWVLGKPGAALGNAESWEVRELIVGFVFWCSAFSALTLAVYVVSTRLTLVRQLVSLWFLFWLSVLSIVSTTYLAWILTCDPLQWLWGFIAKPPFQLFGAPESMSFEEVVALVLLLWLAARCAYLSARGRFEGWIARQRCEDTLRRALEHPFRADLEKGFAKAPPGDEEDAYTYAAVAAAAGQLAEEASSTEASAVSMPMAPAGEEVIMGETLEGPPTAPPLGDGPPPGARLVSSWLAAGRAVAGRARGPGAFEEDLLQEQLRTSDFLGGVPGASRSLSADDGVGYVPRGGSKLMEVRRRALAKACRQRLAEALGSEEILAETMRVHLRRGRILEDTWRVMVERPVSELLAPSTAVSFEGEEGLDTGGIARDWFDAVGRELVEFSELDGGLLCPAPDGTLMPRQVDGELEVEGPQLLALLALGRFAAMAALSGRCIPLTLSLVICKYLLHLPVNMDDVRRLDPEFFRQRVEAVLRPDGVEALSEAVGAPLTFTAAPVVGRASAAAVPMGEGAVEELLPGGRLLLVTETNKVEYVRLLCEAYLCGGVRREIQCLIQGFWDVMPLEVLQELGVGPRELSVLISGVQDLDPLDWQRHSRGSSGEEAHTWFWEVVCNDLGPAERSLLLHFATGSSRLPAGGFRALRPRFSVDVIDGSTSEHLPHAHTCVNKVVLHRYASKDQLRQKLLLALSAEGFAFA